MVELIYCAEGNKRFAEIAIRHGFTYGAQLPSTVYYPVHFSDQDWKKPNRERYMNAVKEHAPRFATVLDLEREDQFNEVMSWANEASQYVSEAVLIIPKVSGIIDRIPEKINGVDIRLAYSVATGGQSQYSEGTSVSLAEFGNRPTHLLGGSPKRQVELSKQIKNVVSADGNYVQMLATRYNQFFFGEGGKHAGFKNKYSPKLSESAYGYIDHDAPYVAFELSKMNIKAYWAGCGAGIRWAVEGDIPAIKKIANQYKNELGFVMIPALHKSIQRKTLFVAERSGAIVGFLNFCIRRDGGITIYEIATDKYARLMGCNSIGKGLISALPAMPIRLKCAIDNPANGFYQHMGFKLDRIEDGRKRKLNVWIKD